jgi:hypothetical protein
MAARANEAKSRDILKNRIVIPFLSFLLPCFDSAPVAIGGTILSAAKGFSLARGKREHSAVSD